MAISMSSPDLTKVEVQAVLDVVKGRYLSIGPRIDAFEQALAAYVGTAHAAGVNSGTSGLHLALIAAGVEANDRVITTPFSFIASSNCILYERAVPVFVDVDPLTGNIDPALVAESGRRPGGRRGRGGALAAAETPRHRLDRATEGVAAGACLRPAGGYGSHS